MVKRSIIFGTYDTAQDGLWTLSALKLSKPTQVQHFLAVPGRRAPLDCSTLLTDGEPYYESRSLEATLESSEGDRLAREDRANLMVNRLDGMSMNIYLPDDPLHYLVGRVQVTPEYNDMAHCAVKVAAVCEPWRYAVAETVVNLTATAEAQKVTLTNSGRLPVVPDLDVTGEVLLAYNGGRVAMVDGHHVWPALYLTPGAHELTYSGAGTVEIRYREAVL